MHLLTKDSFETKKIRFYVIDHCKQSKVITMNYKSSLVHMCSLRFVVKNVSYEPSHRESSCEKVWVTLSEEDIKRIMMWESQILSNSYLAKVTNNLPLYPSELKDDNKLSCLINKDRFSSPENISNHEKIIIKAKCIKLDDPESKSGSITWELIDYLT